jgi:hypothetical protein
MRTPSASHDTMSRLFAAALLVPLLAACGSSATPPASGSARPSTARPAAVSPSASPSAGASEASPTASVEPSAPAPVQQLACGTTGPGWPVTALDRPASAETGTSAAARALNKFVTGPDGASLPDTGWRELYRSKELALYAQADPSGQPGALLVVTARATNGIWAGAGSELGCRPRTWLGNTLGLAADWKLSAKPSKTSTTLTTLVTERSCASGHTARGRIPKPRITYEATRIVITVGVKPRAGSQDCQANPTTPLTITLSEALGDRRIFDGGPYPAVEVAQPK